MSEKPIHALISALPGNFCLADVHGQILLISPAYLTYLQIQEEQIKGQSLSALFSEKSGLRLCEGQEEIPALLQEIRSGADRKFLRVHALLEQDDSLKQDKEEVELELSFSPICFDGKLQYILHELTDQTQKHHYRSQVTSLTKEKEQQLRLFNTALSNTVDFIYTFDLDHRFTYINQALLDLWELSLDEARGKNFKELNYPDELVALHKGQLDTVIDTKAPVRGENFFTSASGTRYYEYYFVPILDKEGKVEGIAGSTRDITDHYHLKQELKERHKDLEVLNTELNTVINKTAHDLRAPISNIEGLLELFDRELAKSEPNADKQDKIFSLIKESVRRFNKTLQEQVDTAELKRSLKEGKEVSISSVLQEVLLDVDPLLNQNKGEVLSDLQVDEVRFPRQNLRSLFYNLVSNALKYTHPERPPEVVVESRKKGNDVLIIVRDNGKGIPEHKLASVFQPRVRIENEIEGSGMGLYIVKQMVENVGGSIYVESEEGKSTCFQACLPG